MSGGKANLLQIDGLGGAVGELEGVLASLQIHDHFHPANCWGFPVAADREVDGLCLAVGAQYYCAMSIDLVGIEIKNRHHLWAGRTGLDIVKLEETIASLGLIGLLWAFATTNGEHDNAMWLDRGRIAIRVTSLIGMGP